MRKILLAAVALGAAAVLAGAIAASARQFRISETGAVVRFSSFEVEGAGTTVRCPVSLGASFSQTTLAKTAESHLTSFTSIALGTCTGGTATVLAETLPWEMKYQGFTGTLPRISSISGTLIGIRLKFHPEGSAECLAGTTAEHPGGGIVLLSNGIVTGLRVDETRRIPLGGGFLCTLGGEASARGSASVTNLPGVGSITVTLI